MDNNIKNKYIATFVLHALGDTIGFKNNEWEFNYNQNINDIRATVEIISEFIELGGFSSINLKDWIISDDTILNYEIGKFLLFNDNNELTEDNILKLKKNIVTTINKDKLTKNRGYGLTTINSIEKWTDDKDERHFKYNINSGGNGCAMRTLPIGLRFNKDKELDELIDFAINTSKLTHNSPIGFLGGLASAYFVKLGINNVPINKWVYLLIDLYESDKVRKYININNDNIYFDYRNSIKLWKKYIEIFFDENKKKLEIKTSRNIISRFTIFIELEKSMKEDSNKNNIGGNGQSAIIMAYNALLDCDGNFEKLIYYSMLHGGDSDTVGAIAAGFYGSVYGFGNVPDHMLKYLEMKKELYEIGEKFYKKFN